MDIDRKLPEHSLPVTQPETSRVASVPECHPSELRCLVLRSSVPGFRCGEVRLAVAAP